MIRAAIFDLDGTLVDSLPGIANALNQALTSMNLPPHSMEAVRTFIGNGSWMLARRGLGGDPPDEIVDEVHAAFVREYAGTWRDGTTIYPGIRELLEELQHDGLPLAVLSNKPHHFTVEMVEALFAGITFASILGQRSDVPKKPDPTAALEIADALALPPAEIAFVGDSTVDFETAHAAGMQPLLVTWGFHALDQLTATAAPLLHSAQDLRESLPGPHPAA